MDEEFDSLIVTDPDLVDPGIDISGIKTKTDVSPYLLGNIPDYAGIQYEAFNPRRLSELMRLFGPGLPAIDTAQIPGAIDTLVNTGDGGQATAPITTPTQPDSIAGFDPGVTPGPSGFIGLDPDMDIDPRDIDDYGTYTPPTTPVDNRIQIENISADPYSVGMDIDDPGASIENLAALQTRSGATPDLKPIQDLPMAQEPLDIPTQDVGLAYTGEFDPDDEGTVFDTSGLTDATPEQRSTIQNILTAAGDNVQGALTQLGKIPGAIVDFSNQTVDFFGKKLNVGKTLAGFALNKMVGGPATLIFELAENILPEGNIAPSTNIARSTGLLQGDTTVTKDKYGINTQTSFDPVQSTINYNEYNVEQVEDLNNALTNLEEKYEATWNEEQGVFIDKKTGLPSKKANDMTTRMRTELEDRKEYLNTVNKDPLYGGDIDERDQMLEDIVAQNKIDEGTKFVDTDGGGEFDTTPTTTTGDNPFANIDTGVEDFDTTPVDEFSDEAFMVGDTSTAAPTTGDSGADSFFDAVDTATGGGGGRDRDPDPSPSFDPGQGFVDTGGGGEFDTTPSTPDYSNVTTGGPPSQGGGGGNGGSSSGGRGCVIATHAVNSGAFTKDTKREAVRWCVKNLHRTWWGEAIRRGYRYYGQKAIEEGKAKNHYQEFKDYVAFGTGKRRTLKTGWTFVYRSIQFFIRGLING